MLSHPPSGRVPAHCVVRVSLDARPLPPALGLRRPRGFFDPIVAFDYHAPYFRASRPYISIFSLASAKTPVDKYQNRPAPTLRSFATAGGGSLSICGSLQRGVSHYCGSLWLIACLGFTAR